MHIISKRKSVRSLVLVEFFSFVRIRKGRHRVFVSIVPDDWTELKFISRQILKTLIDSCTFQRGLKYHVTNGVPATHLAEWLTF